MSRTTKGIATLALAMGIAAGTGQSASFAVANDSHTPVVVADSSLGSATLSAQGEGHSPAPDPR